MENQAADRDIIEFVNDELRTYILPEQITKLRNIFHANPQTGNTLAYFANTGKVFKRPDHAAPYTFGPEGRDHLKEVESDGRKHLPRLTSDDVTATDWEEVEE